MRFSHLFRSWIVSAFVAISLSACVGGSFGNSQEFEMFPLRAASETEGRKLKSCLQSAHEAQQAQRKKTGHYTRKIKDLPLDSTCNGFLLAQKGTSSGYEIKAELREEETVVRWSVNEKGMIEEHLEIDEGDELAF